MLATNMQYSLLNSIALRIVEFDIVPMGWKYTDETIEQVTGNVNVI
jgi:hypothetical protein